MEPIERELAELRERRKRLAIELQALEGRPSSRKAVERAERARQIAELRHSLDLLAFSIDELEEIVAEGPNPPRMPRPPIPSPRRLSKAERKAIEAEVREQLGDDASRVQIIVPALTGPDGTPEIRIVGEVNPGSPDEL